MNSFIACVEHVTVISNLQLWFRGHFTHNFANLYRGEMENVSFFDFQIVITLATNLQQLFYQILLKLNFMNKV